jgi:hypothetical protein
VGLGVTGVFLPPLLTLILVCTNLAGETQLSWKRALAPMLFWLVVAALVTLVGGCMGLGKMVLRPLLQHARRRRAQEEEGGGAARLA